MPTSLSKIKSYIRTLEPDAKVVLYGSRARGDYNSSSDWDFLVLLNKGSIEPEDYDKISWPLYKMGWDYGEQFSIKLYTLKDWEKRSFTPFYKSVEKEGIIL
jgi:predicted nucleotidyltransferase